jgi:hypothetical protein
LAAEAAACVEESTWVERITVSEHFMLVEHVPERRARPRERTPGLAA